MAQLALSGHIGRMESKRISPEALMAALRAAKMTQRKLAEKSHLTEAMISKIKAGTVGVSPETLTAIEGALGVPAGSLIMPAAVAQLGPAEPPPGVLDFLARNEKALGITQRERWYLLQSHFRAEPWVVFDDTFWAQMHTFWRNYLRENR